jgi:hypothetical protein
MDPPVNGRTRIMKPLKHYQDIVSQSGKFELENPITPYLYDISLDGDGEEICSQDEGQGIWASKFTLTYDELEHFNLDLPDHDWHELILVEDSQGFVMSMTPNKFKAWIGEEIASELAI